VRFHRIAGKHPRPADNAAAIQHQAQGHQRAVAALFLGPSLLRFGLRRRRAFEIGSA
jgi:hypothetical protein